MSAAAAPTPRQATIGRFQVIGTLGQGSQSVVYLAFDPQLHREVAVKSLRLRDSPAAAEMMLNEARAVSRLSHPGLVPVFEAGEQDGNPYLVFEYVAGQTLAERLAAAGAMAPESAVDMLLPVLDAVDYAHGNRVIHRDLKPSNILLDAKGRARVMDFGVAVRHAEGRATSVSDELFGTPAYMAPEYARSGRVSPQMDVFSAGLILYEMLCGQRAVPETSGLRAIHHIVHEDIRLPPQAPHPLDPRLRAVVERALARDATQRYPSMRALAQALRQWQVPVEAPTAGADSGAGTQKNALDYLLRRMRLRGDPPALSAAVSDVVRLASSDRQNVVAVADAILRDSAMTHRILRMVNSSVYQGMGGGPVTTITRAILMLGYNAIRTVATSLNVLEQVSDRAQALRLQDEFLLSQCAGILARELSGLLERDGEEAFVCGTLQGFGRLLATHYFPDDAAEIRRNTLSRPDREEQLARQVLGMGYAEFGVGMARHWGLPELMVHSMFGFEGDAVLQAPRTRAELLRAVCALAGEMLPWLALEGQPRHRAVQVATARYAKALSLTERELQTTFDQAVTSIRQLARELRLDLNQTDTGRHLLGLRSLQPAQATLSQARGASADRTHAGTAPAPPVQPVAPAVAATAARPLQPAMVARLPTVTHSPVNSAQRQDLLSAGIQEVAVQLVGAYKLNELLRAVLQCLQRAVGFERVAFLLRDGRSPLLTERLAVGPGTDNKPPLKLALDDKSDSFAAAVGKGVDLFIADASAPAWALRVPSWHRASTGAQSVLLLPLHINGVPVGLIYADHHQANVLQISDKDLALMRTLRNQMVLAFRQKSS